MLYRSLRFASFLVPLAALVACSGAADPAPFQPSGALPSNTSTQPAGASDAAPSSPGSSSAAPVAAATGRGSESTAPLPLTPSDAAGSTPAAPAPVVPVTPATPPVAPVTPANTDPSACASYDTGFLPLVHQPVCSGCHTATGGLPRFEPFAQAERRCSLIGQLVASGEMPPRGSLSAQQKAIVASWVSLDCPETAADAALLCPTPPANPANPANPAPGATPPPTNPAPGATPPAPPRAGDDDDDGADDDDDGGDDDDGNDDD